MSKNTVVLHHGFNLCKHQRELKGLTATRMGNRWLIRGDYACRYCQRMMLEGCDERPDDVLIAGRGLPVRIEESVE